MNFIKILFVSLLLVPLITVAVPICLAPIAKPDSQNADVQNGGEVGQPRMRPVDIRDQGQNQNFSIVIGKQKLKESSDKTQCVEVKANKVAIKIIANDKPKESFFISTG